MKHKHLVVPIIVMLAAMGSVRAALADIGPSPPPAGASIDAGDSSTMVQMVSEDVLMTIVDNFAYVKATFDMRNMGTVEEAIKVRFPMNVTAKPTEERIENFSAYVDGKSVEVAVEEQPYPGREGCEDCLKEPWSTWHVTFSPGQLVKIGVMYQVKPSRLGGMVTYRYVIATGAGWYGPIGEGTVTCRLPYELDEQNVWIDEDQPQPSPDYYTISGSDIVWHFTDLEPTWETGVMEATVIGPPEWRELQTAQKEVDANPNSASAHLRLARALRNSLGYSSITGTIFPFDSDSNMERANRAVQEYEHVLREMPDVIDYRVEYIGLLESMADFDKECLAAKQTLTLVPDDEWLLSSYDYCLRSLVTS